MRMHRLKHSELARHVMGLRCNRAKRPAPEYEFALVDAQEISEVGVAAGKLRHSDALLCAGDFSAQPISQSFEIQFLA